MFKTLVAIIMLVSTGAVFAHGCNHDSVSHKHSETASVNTGTDQHQDASNSQDETNHGHCCQFHCHQLVSLVSASTGVRSFEPRDITLYTFKVVYTGPALTLLTRPPLAA